MARTNNQQRQQQDQDSNNNSNQGPSYQEVVDKLEEIEQEQAGIRYLLIGELKRVDNAIEDLYIGNRETSSVTFDLETASRNQAHTQVTHQNKISELEKELNNVKQQLEELIGNHHLHSSSDIEEDSVSSSEEDSVAISRKTNTRRTNTKAKRRPVLVEVTEDNLSVGDRVKVLNPPQGYSGNEGIVIKITKFFVRVKLTSEDRRRTSEFKRARKNIKKYE